MITSVVTWALTQRTKGPAEKAVLFVIAAHADRNGTARLSYPQIAEGASIHTGNLAEILGRLRDQQLITWTKGAGRRPSTYQLALPAP